MMNDKKGFQNRFNKDDDDDDQKKGGLRPTGGKLGGASKDDDDDDKKGSRPVGAASGGIERGGITGASKEEDDNDPKKSGARAGGSPANAAPRGGVSGASKDEDDDRRGAPRAGFGGASKDDDDDKRESPKPPMDMSKLASAAAGAFVAGGALSAEEENALRGRITTLRSRYNSLFDRVNLNDIVSEINDMTRRIDKLPEQISEIRRNGYSFASYLEQKSDVLQQRWNEIRANLNTTTERESVPLRNDLKQFDQHILQAQQALDSRRERASDRFLDELENGLGNIENQVGAIERRLRSSYETLSQDSYQAEAQINKIKWYVEQIGQACFKLYAGESVFMVAEAQWLDGRDAPSGFLYLTDQRMLFEQRETTGKFLGLFGGQQQHDVEWEFPLTAVEKVAAENQGFFGGKDVLNFTLGSGASYPKLSVEVKGDADCKVWAQQINRMRSGDARNERSTEAAPELIEALKNAPSQCHVCGATLPAVMQGQMQIECAYCGTVIRLVQ